METDPDKDTAVFGYNLSPKAPFALDDVPIIVTLPDCPFVFGVIARGVQNENAVYFAPQSALNGVATPWRRLADFGDDVVAVDENGGLIGLAAHGDDVYLLTHKDASRYKIVKTSLKHPRLSHAETVVPSSDVVIRTMGQAKDALYVQDLDGGLGHLRRVSWDGQQETLSLPFPGRSVFDHEPPAAGNAGEDKFLDKSNWDFLVRPRHETSRQYRTSPARSHRHVCVHLAGSQGEKRRRDYDSPVHHLQERSQTGRLAPDFAGRIRLLRHHPGT